MAKRKRLTPAQPGYLSEEPATAAPETKSAGLSAAAAAGGRPPIAQVAGEASAAAALQELAGEMGRARDEGRLIQALDVDSIEAGYLVRDRMLADEDELRVLMESLRARGQQTPVEVVALDAGRYGLISGWRRLTALKRLRDETGEARFARVQAILRQPESAAAAYVAMVEENEIRVGLSYYERARVAAKAVEQGVYADEKEALLQLFSAASRAKRSKIRSFLPIYHCLDPLLRFPTAIPERVGLALAKAIEANPAAIERLQDSLSRQDPQSAEDEIALIEAALAGPGESSLSAGTETKPDLLPEPYSKSESPASEAKASTSDTRSVPDPDAMPETDPISDVTSVTTPEVLPEALDTAAPRPGHVAAGPFRDVCLAHDGGGQGTRIVLTGRGVDARFREALIDWLKHRR